MSSPKPNTSTPQESDDAQDEYASPSAQPQDEVFSASHLESLLTRFKKLVELQESTDRSALNYEWAWRHRGGALQFHLGVSVMIHGDEVGPLEGLIDFMEALAEGRIEFPGTFTCFIGNPEAARLQRRFVDLDLNRVIEPLAPDSDRPLAHEVLRAQRLLPLLDQFDLYIDFHQTILDSVHPFYICPWNVETWRWMRVMGGAKMWVTRHPERGGGGLKCADEYVRQRGVPSVALELGVRGFSAQARSRVWRSLVRVINTLVELEQGEVTLEQLAEQQPELTFYETHTRYPFDDSALKLAPGWVNFSPVHKGMILTAEASEDDEFTEHTPRSEHDALSNQDADGAPSKPLKIDSLNDLSDDSPEIETSTVDSTARPSPSSSTSTLTLHATTEGALLFPKYPPRDEEGRALDPCPKELCRIIKALDEHPLTLWQIEDDPEHVHPEHDPENDSEHDPEAHL